MSYGLTSGGGESNGRKGKAGRKRCGDIKHGWISSVRPLDNQLDFIRVGYDG